MIVTLHAAEGSFEYFTKKQWQELLDIWCETLMNNGHKNAIDMTEKEIVEHMFGGELFFDIVPTNEFVASW